MRRAQEIVRGMDLAAAPCELTCIIGPNGAGKSTALKLVAGLLHRSAGGGRRSTGKGSQV